MCIAVRSPPPPGRGWSSIGRAWHDSVCHPPTLSAQQQCQPRCQSRWKGMSKPGAFASMTSASSFPAPNLVRACPNCSPDRRPSSSNEERHTSLHPPHLLATMTLSDPQHPPDPREHRFFFSSPTTLSPLLTLFPCSFLKRLSRKFSLNEGEASSAPLQRRSSLPPSSRTRLPRDSSTSLPSTPIVTIPLRPCCPDCFSATESAAVQGDDWIENFSRPARRRRSVSTDNRPCPPHLLATTSGATIRWSTVAGSPSASSAFQSVVVDEVGDRAGHTDDEVPGSDGQGINKVRNGLDRLRVGDPDDDVLPPLLSRHKPWLSPIPSNNASVDDLSPERAASEEGDSSAESAYASPASSPMLPTPSSSVAPTPASSPTILYPSPPRGRESSPRMPGSFRVPKGGALLRAGSDILKGVNALGGGPIV